MRTKKTLAVLLAGSMAASGFALAPAARQCGDDAARRRMPLAAAKTMITATPSTTNRSGVVTVSGSGFVPNETVKLSISGMSGVAVTAKADAKGMLPATGLTIPYSLKPGSYTVTATGVSSKRASNTMIKVAALTPVDQPERPLGRAGRDGDRHREGLRGQGAGDALAQRRSADTTPAVITTTNGAFTATFTVPKALLNGANSISAIGNESRVNAVTSLDGEPHAVGAVLLCRRDQYVARPLLRVVAQHQQAAGARASERSTSTRAPAYTADVTVNATSQKRVSVASLGNYPEGTYGLVVKSDRPIAAQVATERDGMDGDVMLGNSAPDTHWYLAAGATSGTFQENVSIFNPDPSTPTGVQLQLVTAAGKMGKTVMVTVPAHTNYVANVNKLFPEPVVGRRRGHLQPPRRGGAHADLRPERRRA